jgi:opacity protein-like surface antigen
MKKLYFLLFTVIWMANNAWSQENEQATNNFEKGFYVGAAIGFGFGLCYYDPCCYYDESNYSPSYDVVKGISLMWGKGINGQIEGGYNFNKYIGVDLGVRDFWGLNIKKTSDGNSGTEGGYFTETNKFRAMVLEVIPSVVISPGFDDFNPYAKFGVSVGVYPAIYRTESQTTGNTTIDYKGVYYGHIPVGYSVAGGLQWNFADNMNVHVEADFDGEYYSPAHYKVTEYKINGVDHFSDLTNKQKYIDFVKTYDKLETIPDDSHNKRLKESFPLTGIGLNVGFTMKF